MAMVMAVVMGGAIAEVAAIIMGGDGGMAIITVGRAVVIAAGIEACKKAASVQGMNMG